MTFRPLPARSPAALLREAKPLQGLLNQAERLARLQDRLHSQLQPAAREHCHVASWHDGSLLLIVTDGHWATRLRYQQRRLLRQLQGFAEFAGLHRILFKVQPPQVQSQGRGRCANLSVDAAENIRATAEHIDDPRLRAALERLASHGDSRNE
ncbi:Dna[CI] antecedent, DciA [compost metagenome]